MPPVDVSVSCKDPEPLHCVSVNGWGEEDGGSSRGWGLLGGGGVAWKNSMLFLQGWGWVGGLGGGGRGLMKNPLPFLWRGGGGRETGVGGGGGGGGVVAKM